MNRRSFLKALSTLPFVGGLAVTKPKVADTPPTSNDCWTNLSSVEIVWEPGEFEYKGYTFRLNERDSSHTYLSDSEWQVYLEIDGRHGGCYVPRAGFNLEKRDQCCDDLIAAAERSKKRTLVICLCGRPIKIVGEPGMKFKCNHCGLEYIYAKMVYGGIVADVKTV